MPAVTPFTVDAVTSCEVDRAVSVKFFSFADLSVTPTPILFVWNQFGEQHKGRVFVYFCLRPTNRWISRLKIIREWIRQILGCLSQFYAIHAIHCPDLTIAAGNWISLSSMIVEYNKQADPAFHVWCYGKTNPIWIQVQKLQKPIIE